MAFPSDVKEKALIACARHCCICHRFVGIKIELHHILHKSEGGQDTFDNCIPLCFDCHGDMRSYDHKHPKGTKYTKNELVQHRDSWYKKVAENPVSTYTSDSAQLDKKVLEELSEVLSWKTVRFVRTNNFAGHSYRRSTLEPLWVFLDRCENPAFEFLDTELEGHRAELKAAISELDDLLNENAFSLGTNLDFSSVPQEWEIEQPARFWKVVRTIHSAAKRIGTAYDQIVRVGRRKLGVGLTEPK